MGFISQFIALIIFFMISPFLLLVSLLIYIFDGYPILFKQKRIGKNNSTFYIYKFRTMKQNMRDIPTNSLNKSNSHYTKLGPFLRKMSIDELPQIINIILGNMLFIGPRPALYNQYDLIDLRKKNNIDKLKPGITGWAQINGRDNLTIQEKVNLDKYYLKNNSLSLNIKILILTVVKTIRSEDVV